MAKGNFRYLVLSYLRLEGISNFEGNRPGNHQNSLKSRPGNNKGIKYHRWLYVPNEDEDEDGDVEDADMME